MPPSARAGVVAFSSGNHAQGVALAASLLGIRATIVMPHDAPRAKVAATRGYGAEIVVYERGREDRAAVAARVARERGGTIVPPFDDPAIVAGQGTVALELLEDVPDLDVLVAPLGGGGLLAGCALATRGRGSRAELWGVEPEAGDDFRRSLAGRAPGRDPGADDDRRRPADAVARRDHLSDRARRSAPASSRSATRNCAPPCGSRSSA